MELNQYPTAIAAAAQALNDLELDITKVRRQIARIECRADAKVATNPNLQSDVARQAERFYLLDISSKYQELLDDLENLMHQKSTAMAELERARNQFSVAKIEARAAIAQQIVGLERADFVGL
jgi:chromosome segregation ATPase